MACKKTWQWYKKTLEPLCPIHHRTHVTVCVVAAIPVSAGREYSDWQLRTHHFSKAAAGAWAQVNLNAKKWATENGWGMKGQYSITR
jgi:hypothetical protein